LQKPFALSSYRPAWGKEKEKQSEIVQASAEEAGGSYPSLAEEKPKTGLKKLLSFSPLSTKKEKKITALPPEGEVQFQLAKQLFADEKYEEAEKTAKKLLKKYKFTPIGEDTQFLLAESQYYRKRYSFAQDSYDQLLKDHPSTRYLDESTQRLFTIAGYWLGYPEFATSSEIQQVNLEESRIERPEPQKKSSPGKWPIIPNFTDRSRPVFDTPGRALQALKSIWLNDPTGPLADDALMLSATYYLRRGRYMDADRTFTLLREEYPKSPHVQDAFLLGSHVKLMSYQGANYDSKSLDEAGQLKESTLRMFPDGKDNGRLKAELANIENAKALREWEKAQFYMRKKLPKSEAVYCQVLIQKFPKSPYANLAKKRLNELGPEVARIFFSSVDDPTTIPVVETPPIPTNSDAQPTSVNPVPKKTPAKETPADEEPGRIRLNDLSDDEAKPIPKPTKEKKKFLIF